MGGFEGAGSRFGLPAICFARLLASPPLVFDASAPVPLVPNRLSTRIGAYGRIITKTL